MIGWCSKPVSEWGRTNGAGGHVHADPTCPMAPDPLVMVEVRDGLLLPTMRQSKGIRVRWCAWCERPSVPGDWADRAACKGMDQNLFFARRSKADYKQGKRICLGGKIRPPCPVLAECRQFALDKEPGGGLWGGMTEQERDRIREGRLL